MSKIILAAGVIWDLHFDSLQSLERYIERLEFNSQDYQELERCERPNGCYILRIVTQLRDIELIEL